jgi:hypothetical protein
VIMFKKALFISLILALGAGAHASAAPGRMSCINGTSTNNISCGFETFDPIKPTEVKLRINGEQTKSKLLEHYPAGSQTTAILFLVDISDPRRGKTVARNVAAIRKVVGQLARHHKVGLAVFDSSLKVLAPLGSSTESMDKALDQIRAGGAATEFYKNVIAGSMLLEAFRADRKALVLFSDGKAEDQAYGRVDATKALSAARISVIGLGYAETKSDVPFLQTMERLSKETGGAFYSATQAGVLPQGFYASPFQSVETGGRFTFDAGHVFGSAEVQADIISKSRKLQSLSANIDVNKGRPLGRTALAFLKSFWVAAIIVLLFLILTTVLIVYRRRRASNMETAIEFGFLEGLDGQASVHSLVKKAIRIGRGEESDIQLLNGSVSRNHAELHRKDDGWHIVDLGSTNGVRVNDEVVTSALLRTSDVLEIGEVRFRFVEY